MIKINNVASWPDADLLQRQFACVLFGAERLDAVMAEAKATI